MADGMDPQFNAALMAMIAASGGRISITSGYRDVATQARLFAQAQQKYGANARQWVAPPGKSNHNRGIAADLSGDLELAHQLAPQFGLVFPMSWEPWHIEPVGARDNADPEAYTEGPVGTVNPVEDQSLSTQTEFLLANLSAAMRGDIVGEGEVASDTTTAGEMGGDAETWIRDAMRITGVGEDWYAPLKARMMQESGGRNIPQGITDINTERGTPAFGPMQVIQPTFEANKVEGYDDWHNPVDNTVAAIRYIQGRYGHPSKLPQGGY